MTGLKLACVTLVVEDYDEAITWFREKLGFALVEDANLGGGKRWVVVAPSGDGQSGLLLAKAEGETQRQAIGHAAGGRVAFFLHTDDFASDHARMLANGIKFREPPRHEAYGTVAVFEDLYGNAWDLIEPAPRG